MGSVAKSLKEHGVCLSACCSAEAATPNRLAMSLICCRLSPLSTPFYLPLPNHVHDLVPLQGSPCGFEGEEAQPRISEAFDEAVILLDQGIEVLPRPQFTRYWNGPGCFQFVERLGVGGVSIDRDHARSRRVGGSQ